MIAAEDPSGLNPSQLLALLQLSSPALPIGGFSYSQGLEAAVELELVHDEPSALDWIEHQLTMVMARSEAPLWNLLFDAWLTSDSQAIAHWNEWFFASRETQELRQETEQMGASLYKLSIASAWWDPNKTPDARQWLTALEPMTLPAVHAFICTLCSLPKNMGLAAYLFSWLENQVAAAIKSIPLGQIAGQRVLTRVRCQIPSVVKTAQAWAAADPPVLNTFAPQYAMVSSRHAYQFSRLFRS